jgi:hypothetical protein
VEEKQNPVASESSMEIFRIEKAVKKPLFQCGKAKFDKGE